MSSIFSFQKIFSVSSSDFLQKIEPELIKKATPKNIPNIDDFLRNIKKCEKMYTSRVQGAALASIYYFFSHFIFKWPSS